MVEIKAEPFITLANSLLNSKLHILPGSGKPIRNKAGEETGGYEFSLSSDSDKKAETAEVLAQQPGVVK